MQFKIGDMIFYKGMTSYYIITYVDREDYHLSLFTVESSDVRLQMLKDVKLHYNESLYEYFTKCR